MYKFLRKHFDWPGFGHISQEYFLREGGHTPTSVGQTPNALILSPPEMSDWSEGRIGLQGSRNAALRGQNKLQLWKEKRYSYTTWLYRLQRRRAHCSLCLISQGLCADLFHTPCPVSDGWLIFITWRHSLTSTLHSSSPLGPATWMNLRTLELKNEGFLSFRLSTCDPWTRSSTWEIVRNANFRASSQTCQIRNSGDGVQGSVL